MWDDRAERDRPGDRVERRAHRVRGNRDDEPDPHVPRVELLHLFEVAEPGEQRDERWYFPGPPIDRRGGAIWQRPRELAFPAAAGEAGARVAIGDLAQRPALREIRAMSWEQRGAAPPPGGLL